MLSVIPADDEQPRGRASPTTRSTASTPRCSPTTSTAPVRSPASSAPAPSATTRSGPTSASPFGGFKQSGIGREGGTEGCCRSSRPRPSSSTVRRATIASSSDPRSTSRAAEVTDAEWNQASTRQKEGSVRIGTPTEIKVAERRVGLTPDSVHELACRRSRRADPERRRCRDRRRRRLLCGRRRQDRRHRGRAVRPGVDDREGEGAAARGAEAPSGGPPPLHVPSPRGRSGAGGGPDALRSCVRRLRDHHR